MAKKIEMLNDQQEVVHPLTSSDCVIMENGKTLEEVMGDGIATPTVTHEGASFQVGVGDSNIEVVDGDVAGMTLEGQTYQNILPKPTTLIMGTDEKEFRINDKIDNNIVLDDNVAEIATIKGQTYVNVVQEESASEYVAIDEELNGQSITTTGKPEGYVKNATLEGLTLVNTIQEPSGADATVLELDANIDAQYATIDNTVQGGIHGVALKGQTLVNIHKSATYSLSRQNEGWYENLVAETNRISFEVTDTSTDGWRYLNLGKLNLDMLKPNTKYLVYFGVANFPHNLGVRFMNGNATDKISNEAMVAQGSNWAILTTSSEIIKSEQVLYVSFTNVLGKVEVGNAMIIEYQQGMENWDISYFEGMQSVEVPSVKTTGKNLFDGGVFYTDIIGNSATGNCELLINGLKIKKNTEYVISFEYETDTDRPPSYYCILTKTKQTFDNHNKMYTYHQNNYLDGNSVNKPMLQFNSGEFEYLYLSQSSTASTVDGYMSYSNIQLEKGSTVTTYEPYKSSTAKVGLLPILETEKSTYYSSSSGNKFTNPAVNTVKYKVQGLSKVYVKVAHSNFSYWDANNTYIGGQATIIGSSNNAEGYLNIPTNAVYMRCAVDNTKIAEVYESVTLRKVGDVQDELDLETGEVTQRIGEAVLNGSESGWFKSSSVTGDGGYRYALRLNDGIIKDHAKIMCDKFAQSENAKIGYVNYLAIDNGLKSALYFNSTIETVDEFKQWLSQNPITVQYQLATPIIRQVDLSIVDQSNKPLKTIQAHPTLTHITTSSNGLIPFVSIPSQLKYPTIIKPSTQYTLKLKRDVVDSANQLTVNVGGVSTSVTSDIMTITTPDTLTSQDIVLTGKNNVVSKLQLIEGDVTGIDYPFFEGMLDVKSPKLLATGKNLFDKNSLIFGAVAYSTGEKYSYRNNNTRATLKLGSLIRVEPNSTITLSCNSNFKCVIQKYDENEFPTAKNDSGWQNKSYHTLKLDNKTRKINIYFTKQDPYSTESITNEEMQILKDSIQVEYNSTATSYEPYKGVTIEQDIDSIPLTSDMFEQGAIDDGNTSTIVGMSYQQMVKTNMSNRYRSKQIIPVKPNGKYILNCDAYAVLFDKNGAYVKNGSNTNIPITNGTEFTIPSYVYYIAPCLKTATINSNLTLQEVPQEIVLRSLPNGVKDTLNLTTGEYVQRIGEVVFDGSDDENWFIHEEEQDNYINKRFRTDYLRGKILYFDGGTICNIICDKVQCYPNLTWKDDREGIEHDSFYVSFRKNCETVTKFKQCLSQDPITIQYQLITPIIKKVNLTNATKLPSYNSTTHYDTIVPSNSLIPNIKLPSTIDYNVAIKPSTQYTVRCNTTNALSVNLGGATGTLANGKVILTTPSTLAHNSLKLGNGKAKEVMVIEGSEIKDNVPFFNGMKNVQMGGIKLVNIARGVTVDSDKIVMNANKTQFTYTSDGTNWGHVLFDKSLLKQNTLYTIYLNVISSNSDNSNPIKITMGDDWNTWLNVSSIGLFKQTFTTNDKLDGLFGINFRPCTSGQQVVIQNPMIIEGDWTHLDEIPFIESEMIIEQPIIRSQGKNLFNINIKENVVNWNGANIKSNSDNTITFTPNSDNSAGLNGTFKFVKPIRFKVGTQFTYTFNRVSGGNSDFQGAINARLRVNKKDGSQETLFIGDLTSSYFDKVISKTYTFTEDFDSIVSIEPIMYSVRNLTSPITIRYQLEEGSSATTYEPFKQHTLSSNRVIGYEENCYYASANGVKTTQNAINSMLADVEGLPIAYVTGGSSNYTFWDKDDVFISGKQYLDTSLSSYDKNGFITVPSNAKYMRFAAGGETNAQPLYKVATVTGELPLRSLPNSVCDSLNLVTGEYVQRVGEVIWDGSESWSLHTDWSSGSILCLHRPVEGRKAQTYAICNRFKTGTFNDLSQNKVATVEGLRYDSGSNVLYIFISKDRLTSHDTDGFKQYLSQNPITVQYELATPIVRKIGLTAKGNYRETKLNGSENWISANADANNTICTRYYLPNGTSVNSVAPNMIVNSPTFSDYIKSRKYPSDSHGQYEYVSVINEGLYLQIYKNKLLQDSVSGFKQWLSQHPMKVGYLTNQSNTTYSNILKPIFFNNVKVEFMNNNIDIQPTLTLQARSTNSYVLDNIKPSTQYTSKFWHSSYTTIRVKIDNNYFNISNNTTFNSPSTLTNKLLVVAEGMQEFIIIEGDVTRLTIPYYKGIRSAYDNTDEIEIYSVGKNIFDGKIELGAISANGISIDDGVANRHRSVNYIPIKPNTTYIYSCNVGESSCNWAWYDKDKNFITRPYSTKATSPLNAKYLRYFSGIPEGTLASSIKVQIEEGNQVTPYQPYKGYNTTSLPMPTRLETVEVVRPIMEIGRIASEDGQNVDATNAKRSKDYIPVEPDMILMFMNGSGARAENVYLYGINKNYISAVYTNGTGDLIIPEDCYFIRIHSGINNTSDIKVVKKQYKPIALNSLPNGIKDEVIIDPISNKAKLIQRVGKVVLDGSENWLDGGWTFNDIVEMEVRLDDAIGYSGGNMLCDRFKVLDFHNIWQNGSTNVEREESITIFSTNKRLIVLFDINKIGSNNIEDKKQYLSQNPITVQYELETPVVHEISLNGFPHVYKDGSVQLNTEIPHSTMVKYNVNQEQLIKTQNETIIRHDKQIDNLYDYIELYLEEEYRMELFRMQLELSL